MTSDDRLLVLVWVSLILFTFCCVFAGQRFYPVVFGRLGVAGFLGAVAATFMMAAFLTGNWPEALPALRWWMMPVPFLLIAALLFAFRIGESMFADATITISINGNVREIPVRKPEGPDNP